MTKLIEDLFSLQSLLRLGDAASPAQKAQLESLRNSVPEPVLAHFLRQVAVGRKGVAFVRNGVCGECHLRVSHAMNHLLAKTNDLLVCENCGTFLATAPAAPVSTVPPVLPPKPRRRRATRTSATNAPLSAVLSAERAPATDLPFPPPAVATSSPPAPAAA